MKRRLFNLLAGLSLLLLLATAAIWMMSYLHNPLHFAGASTNASSDMDWKVSTSRGRNELLWHSGTLLSNGEKPESSLRIRHFEWNRIGLLGVYNPREKDPDHWKGRYLFISFPSWMMALLSGIVPGIWIVRRRRTPIDERLCRNCGYDLRATLDRCPECGTAPKIV